MSQPPSSLVEPPMLAALRQLSESLDRLSDTDSWPLSDDQVGVALELIAAAEARLAAAKLGVIADADARNIGLRAVTTTAGWLRGRLLMHPGNARRAVSLAGALRRECQATGAALAVGTISAAHAQTISQVVAGLPPVDPPTKVRAEEFLIGQAAVLDPLLLAAAGRALTETLTSRPDSDERLRCQHERRQLTRVVAPDGMVRYLGWFDPEAEATIFAALGPLAAPRPATDGTKDPRSGGQRNADALVDLARIALANGDLPTSGGCKPTVNVTIGLAALQQQIARAGLLPTGDSLSAAAARRLACDAKIIPMILGGASQPIDIGRAARTVPAAMHAALVVRDQACTFPVCDRLAAWSESTPYRSLGRRRGNRVEQLGLAVLGAPPRRPPPRLDRSRRLRRPAHLPRPALDRSRPHAPTTPPLHPSTT